MVAKVSCLEQVYTQFKKNNRLSFFIVLVEQLIFFFFLMAIILCCYLINAWVPEDTKNNAEILSSTIHLIAGLKIISPAIGHIVG